MSFILRKLYGGHKAKRRHDLKWLMLMAIAVSYTATAKAQLSGTYTICASGCSYSSFGAAVTALKSVGVSGPVTFQVQSGTYTERVVIPAIAGASATNTITFDGTGYSATLTYSSSATSNMQVLLLDGADYITIKGLTIDPQGSTYGVGIHLTNAADYNKIINNTIQSLSTATSAYHIGILGSGSTTSYSSSGNSGNYNEIRNNTITGGYYGIRFNGSSSSSLVLGNQYIGNTIKDYYYYGLYMYYHGSHLVRGNTISSRSSSSSFAYGIYNYYSADYVIEKNIVNTAGYGLYLYYNNNVTYGGTPSLVANNMVVTDNNYPLYNYRSSYINIYHNSFLTMDGLYGAYNYNVSNEDIRSNIFETRDASGYAFYYTTASSFDVLDYNIYYAPTSGKIANISGTVYNSLADWQKADPAYNQNSFEQDPGYTSSTDLHLTSSAKPYGPNLGITTDVDNDSRCEMAPTIGADENNSGKNTKPKVSILGPDTIFVNSPSEFVSSASALDPQKNLWYFDGAFVKDSLHLLLVPAKTGTFTLKMVGLGCTQKDSTTKTVVVVAPTKAPVAMFVADKNVIDPGEEVNLISLSTGGATNWKWEITPKVIPAAGTALDAYSYVYGNDSSREVRIQFHQGGNYKVCLTAKNSIGSNTLCKIDYITVSSAYTMAPKNLTVVADTAGTLYDDGGPNGEYSDYATGSFLIAPCAEKVYLIVKKFETECGYDYLRIFDGNDNSGTPLHACTTNTGSANGPGYTGTPGSSCAAYCAPSQTDTFVATTGRMFIEFRSDASASEPGFELQWWSKPLKAGKPNVSFASSDSVCINQPVTFTNVNPDASLTYTWDADNDFTTDESAGKTDLSYMFFYPGEYTVILIGRNACGEADTFSKNITVYNPGTPTASFTTDNTRPTTTDIVFFTADVVECVDAYKWTFTKASGTGTATFVNGTNSTSASPQVSFSQTGCYNVKLFVKNVSGEDSLELSCYINVRAPYCQPAVVTNIADVGISEVSIEDRLVSKSSQGENDFENYVNTRNATVNLGEKFKLTVSRTTNRNEVTRTVWIDWNQDGDFTDANEKVAEEKNAATLNWTSTITVPSTAVTGATVMRIAINLGTNANAPCGPNKYGEFEDYRIYITPDVTPPVITLIGADTIYLEQGYTYTDSGAKAEDNLDGDISSKVIVTMPKAGYNLIPGTYFFSYNVSDSAGNAAVTVKRTIIVTPDATAPELVVATPDTIYIAVGKSFSPPAVISAFDLVDGDLKDDVVLIGSVNNLLVDTFTLQYYVTDLSGNDTTVTRTVIVMDTIAPVITLNGGDTVYVNVGSAFTDPGVTVTDNYYPATQLQAMVTVEGVVDPGKTGAYTLIYRLTDPSGNVAAAVTRTVIVRDIQAPVITLNGDSVILLDVNTLLVDAGVTVNDNYDANPSLTVSGTYYQNFPGGLATKLGSYTIIYTASDSSGNTATVSRNVLVVDRIAPVITLKGEPGANICRWATYSDAGYDLSDNYYSSDSITVTTEGSFTQVQTAVEGTYYLRYKAEDKSGNVGYSDWRQVVVRNPYKFPCSTATSIKDDKGLEKNVKVYPNPNNGKFTVEANIPVNEQVRLTVTNMMGQEVAVISNGSLQSNKFTVDLSTQAAGVYLLNITTSTHTITKRVVVNK